MPAEAPYRIAVALVFGTTVAIVAYHRWQAAQSKERISRKDEGLLLAVVLRVVGGCLWLATIAYLIDPAWMHWAAVPLPSWLRWVGAVFGALGCALMAWTLTNLGKNLTDTVVTRAQATLVTTGPYHYVRHPFYVTVALLIPTAALLSANTFIAACGVAVLTLLVIRTKTEEQKLLDKFGKAYRDYMASTGRFWPRPSERKADF